MYALGLGSYLGIGYVYVSSNSYKHDKRLDDDYIYEYVNAREGDRLGKIMEECFNSNKDLQDAKDWGDMSPRDEFCNEQYGECPDNYMLVDYGFYPVPHVAISAEEVNRVVTSIIEDYVSSMKDKNKNHRGSSRSYQHNNLKYQLPEIEEDVMEEVFKAIQTGESAGSLVERLR